MDIITVTCEEPTCTYEPAPSCVTCYGEGIISTPAPQSPWCFVVTAPGITYLGTDGHGLTFAGARLLAQLHARTTGIEATVRRALGRALA